MWRFLQALFFVSSIVIINTYTYYILARYIVNDI